MLETIGSITVGLLSLAVILGLLQYLYEGVLAYIGFRRFWIARWRYQRQLEKPFPWLRLIPWAMKLSTNISGDFIVGGLRVPADPRKPIRREPFYGA